MGLPKRECQLGYPEAQVRQIMETTNRFDTFRDWMRGQTVAVCNGREFDREAQGYKPTGCGPHGVVYYRQDILRFLEGRPVID